MKLIVNGESHEHTEEASVGTLLAELGANPEHSAITVNGDLIVSKNWDAFKFSEGDTVEVLTFVGGG